MNRTNVLSWNNGSTFTAAKTNLINTSSDATYTYGGSADTWGRTRNDTEFSNTNFRVKVAHSSSLVNSSLDQILVKVYYTTAGGAGGTSTGSTTIRYIHPDHLGSTNVLTDSSGLATPGG